jgi:hypothetical protein
MKYEDIKTYAQRCEKFEGIVTSQMCLAMLMNEIDELREYIEKALKENK